MRLAAIAVAYRWDLEGQLIGSGSPNRLETLSLQEFCGYVWWASARDVDETEREKFRARLWRPPPGLKEPIPAQSPWSVESESRAFQALKMGTSG